MLAQVPRGSLTWRRVFLTPEGPREAGSLARSRSATWDHRVGSQWNMQFRPGLCRRLKDGEEAQGGAPSGPHW